MTLPRKLRGGYPSAPSLPIRLCPIHRSSTRFQGNLEQILEWPYARAKKALKLFPSIGDPGAEKILLFCGVAAGLALESNGLRVLTRIGYGRPHLKNYGAVYRSVQDSLAPELLQIQSELEQFRREAVLHRTELLQIQRELVDRRQKTIVCPTLIPAHLLLRSHGKTICRDGQPLCHECPVEEGCAFRNPGASKVPRNIPGTGD